MSGFQSYDQWKTASPYDDIEEACECCHRDPADCECPVCPKCGEQGNPKCATSKVIPTGHSAALALMDELGHDDLFSVYRSVYKYTDCGPSIGFLVSYVLEQDNGETGPGAVHDERVTRWIYCDDLARPGDWIPPTYVVSEGDDDHSTGDVLSAEQVRELTTDQLARLELVMSRGTGQCALGLSGTPYRLHRDFFMPEEEPMVVVQGVSVSSIVEGVEQCTDTIQLVDAEFTPANFWQAVEDVNQQATEIWNETHGCTDCYEYPEYELHPIDPECKTCGGHGTII